MPYFQKAVDQDFQLSANIFLNVFHAKLVAAKSQKHHLYHGVFQLHTENLTWLAHSWL